MFKSAFHKYTNLFSVDLHGTRTIWLNFGINLVQYRLIIGSITWPYHCQLHFIIFSFASSPQDKISYAEHIEMLNHFLSYWESWWHIMSDLISLVCSIQTNFKATISGRLHIMLCEYIKHYN